MESNSEKKPWINVQNWYKKSSKKDKSDNFSYRKVGSAITKSLAIEKSNFHSKPKMNSLFGSINNICVCCMCVRVFKHIIVCDQVSCRLYSLLLGFTTILHQVFHKHKFLILNFTIRRFGSTFYQNWEVMYHCSEITIYKQRHDFQ